MKDKPKNIYAQSLDVDSKVGLTSGGERVGLDGSGERKKKQEQL